ARPPPPAGPRPALAARPPPPAGPRPALAAARQLGRPRVGQQAARAPTRESVAARAAARRAQAPAPAPRWGQVLAIRAASAVRPPATRPVQAPAAQQAEPSAPARRLHRALPPARQAGPAR